MSSSANKSLTLTKIRSVNRNTQVAKVPIPGSDLANTHKLLDPAREKKLQDIRDKEELKGKVEQLKAVLIKKMTFKYGRINNDAIEESVDEFVLDTDKITPDALNKLENKIQSKISSGSGSKSTGKEKANNNASSSNSSNTYQNTNNTASPRNDYNNKPSSSSNESRLKQTDSNSLLQSSNAKGVEWQVIATYDKVVGDEIENKQREKEKQTRMQFKKSLDDHVSLAKQLHMATAGKEDLAYSAYVQKDVQKHQTEEDIKRKKIKDKELEVMKLRQAQIEEQKRIKDEEKRKDRNFEVGIVKTALEKMQLEKELTLDAKKRDRDVRSQIEKDNVENKAIIAKRQEIERKEDQRMMVEYAAKLDKEAWERDHAFSKRMEKIDKSANHYGENAGKSAADEEKKREALQMKELEKAMEKEHQEFLRKEREKRIRIQKMLADNNVITEHKEITKKQEMEEKLKVSAQYKREEEELKQLIEAERIRKLQEQQRYNDLLNKQLQDRERHRVRIEEMVDQEKRINKDKLTKALARDEIVNQVLHKGPKVATVRSIGPI